MCGILFSKGINEDTFREVLEKQSHRGPDHTDFIKIRDILVGHNRLSIQDVGENSNQPMCIGNYILTFNGEIYNTTELRLFLKKKGIDLSTSGDTEILLKGLINFGSFFLKKIIGMFAFVFYNKADNTCLIGRDYYGQKPLYQAIEDKQLAIGSELNSIKLFFNNNLNVNSINYYLHYGFLPNFETPYINITEFPNNFYRKIDLNNFEIIDEGKIIQNYISNGRTKIDQIKEACQKRLLSDVPLGIFLSSGIDSNSIASFLKDKNPHTYTIKFEHLDESDSATKAAEINKLKHTVLNCNLSETKNLILNLNNLQDGPLADPSIIPMLLMCKEASKKIKVAITGDGGDELLTGYSRYKYISIALILSKVPFFIRSFLGNCVNNYRLRNIFMSKDFDQMVSKIMSGSNDKFLKLKRPSYSTKKIKSLIDYMNAEEQIYLKNDILVKADRTSMRYGLEIRSPFMDYRLKFLKPKNNIRFISQAFNSKAVLKKFLKSEGLKFIAKKKKKGFTYKMTDDLRALQNEIEPIIRKLPSFIPELLELEQFNNFVDDFFKIKHDDYRSIFKLYSLSKWLDQ